MNEAMGKILGMVMAYGVSSLGLFLAYVNYRKRIMGADKVMTRRAWIVVFVVVAAVLAGVGVVTQLAEIPQQEEVAIATEAASPPIAESDRPMVSEREPSAQRARWPWIGILVPATIFLLATWITAALHRHFTTHGHSAQPPAERPKEI